jgi:hypothetical protein
VHLQMLQQQGLFAHHTMLPSSAPVKQVSALSIPKDVIET